MAALEQTEQKAFLEKVFAVGQPARSRQRSGYTGFGLSIKICDDSAFDGSVDGGLSDASLQGAGLNDASRPQVGVSGRFYEAGILMPKI